jgi:branched-chain amino acid transport system substrate-binding protein
VRYFGMTGRTKIALITSTDASGTDAAKQVKAAIAANKNVQLVGEATFNPKDVSAAAQIQRLKSAGPQALIAWSTGAAIGTVFKAVVDAGLDIPVATTNGNQTFAQMHQYAGILPKTLYIPTSQWPKSNEPVPQAVADAKKAFYDSFAKAGVKPDFASTAAWDPALLVVSALKKLGPTATAEQVRDYLSKLKGFAGINGTYDFTKVPQRGLDESNVVVTQWDKTADNWTVVSKPRGIPLGK